MRNRNGRTVLPTARTTTSTSHLQEGDVPTRRPNWTRRAFLGLGLALGGVIGARVVRAAQSKRDFDVVARKYGFRVSGNDRSEIRVSHNDIVHVNFSTEDIAHSFAIEDYRIMKRAEPGRPASFDFRAEKVGTFPITCNLTIDEKCRDMKGTLVVEGK
jgi:heme/copper-type cytochrome/quinol oxidase subunit 2